VIRALLLTVLLLLAGCASEQDPGLLPGEPQIDVDTPALREAKARIGMEDCRPGKAAEPVDGGLPALTLPCLAGGRAVEMSALRGPLVLNLWQSFCGPCRKEMPALQRFHEQYGDRVRVLGVDYQDVRPEAALELARSTGATYPSVADPGGDLNGRGGFPVVRGLPYFVLVDADGAITHVSAGGIESVDEVVAMVEEHLGVELAGARP
jgi:thiol-disulfide isomerase/thioredoxin